MNQVEKGDCVAVFGIRHDRLQRARGGQFLAVLGHTANVKLQSLLLHTSRLVEGRPGAHAPWEVGEVNAEVAVGVFSDQTDVGRHLMRPISGAVVESRIRPGYRGPTHLTKSE